MSSGNGFDFSRFTDSTPGAAPLDAAPSAPRNPWEASASPFAGQPAVPAMVVTGPPLGWLVAGLVIAVVGVAAALLATDQPTVSLVAWLLCGPVAFSVLAVFVLKDVRARANLFYAERGLAVWGYRLGLVIAFAGIVLSALELAFWVGRR